ncbi:MAG TPA: DMT family transporter, partial [Anaerolineae bacterium]|nr:DMT family transporter [Anaerolineae bacterium]
MSTRSKAFVALSVGVISIGFAAIFIVQAGAPGTVSAFYRMAVGAVLIALPFASRVRRQDKALPATGVKLALLGGLLFAVDVALWATGITISGATNPTLMANTAPLWVGLGAMLFFGERPRGLFWLGLVIAMVGAAVVLGAAAFRASEFGLGTLFGLLAAVFYGAYYLVTQRGRVHLSTLSYFWISTATAAIILLLFNLLTGRPITGYEARTYVYFLALGLVAQTMGWLTINYAQGYLPASIVAPTLLIQPVVTAIFAVVLLGEQLAAWQIVGGFLVLLGVYLVHRS